MNELIILVLSGLAGLILGGFFFGGLWWTVRKGLASPRPALWFLGSLLFRTVIVLVGFYFISLGDWKSLIAGLLGFIAARFLVMRLVLRPATPAKPEPEDGHATHA